MSETLHYHVAYGLAGYGPDASDSDGFPTFESLGDALSYARDELSTDVDSLHISARMLAESEDYKGAWFEMMRAEDLDILRMNLDPARASAPLYVDDAVAYRALQQSQLADFPVDVSASSRLYVWDCTETECVDPRPEDSDGYVNEPAYGSPVVSLDGKTLGTAESVPAAFRILARAMQDDGYFPNVWLVNERGNVTLVSLDVETGTYSLTETSYV